MKGKTGKGHIDSKLVGERGEFIVVLQTDCALSVSLDGDQISIIWTELWEYPTRAKVENRGYCMPNM